MKVVLFSCLLMVVSSRSVVRDAEVSQTFLNHNFVKAQPVSQTFLDQGIARSERLGLPQVIRLSSQDGTTTARYVRIYDLVQSNQQAASLSSSIASSAASSSSHTSSSKASAADVILNLVPVVTQKIPAVAKVDIKPDVAHVSPEVTQVVKEVVHVAPKAVRVAPKVTQVVKEIVHVAPKVVHVAPKVTQFVKEVVHAAPKVTKVVKEVVHVAPKVHAASRPAFVEPPKRKFVKAAPISSLMAYNYQYDIESPSSDNYQSAKEVAQDGVITGEYTVVEPTGHLRIVKYTADENGFHADVSYKYNHVQVRAQPVTSVEDSAVRDQLFNDANEIATVRINDGPLVDLLSHENL